MSQIVIDIPSETLVALKVTEAEIGETLRIAAAVKLFELGRLSSGAAARLAGVPRVVFLARLADYGVDTFNRPKSNSSERRVLPEVICDTSPIQYLHQLQLLHILPALAEVVTIPPAVITEITTGRDLGVI
jgi:predicted HTH domain antitoxin